MPNLGLRIYGLGFRVVAELTVLLLMRGISKVLQFLVGRGLGCRFSFINSMMQG